MPFSLTYKACDEIKWKSWIILFARLELSRKFVVNLTDDFRIQILDIFILFYKLIYGIFQFLTFALFCYFTFVLYKENNKKYPYTYYKDEDSRKYSEERQVRNFLFQTLVNYLITWFILIKCKLHLFRLLTRFILS